MARQAWQRTITDAAGNVLTGVQITVFQENGVTLATIYGQQTGGAALANPFSTGLQTSAKFYADPGRYVVRAFKDGLTQEFTDVDIGGKAVRDDLGSAAYLAATTSTTDPTQGRAMRSWDYGLGALAGPTELNPGAVRQTRMMAVNASWDGSPIPGVDAGNQGQLLQMQHGDPTYAIQVLYSLSSSAGDLTRRISNNVAGPWARNITSANMVGTVAAQGGAPALFSAIIERGSNSNGEYVKFADGTMICTSQLLNANVAPSGGPVYFSGSIGPIPSPAAFADLPIAGFAGSTSENIWFGVLPNVSGSYVRAFSTTAGAAANYRITLVGRWR